MPKFTIEIHLTDGRVYKDEAPSQESAKAECLYIIREGYAMDDGKTFKVHPPHQITEVKSYPA